MTDIPTTPPTVPAPTVRSLRAAARVSCFVGNEEGSILLYDGGRYVAVEYRVEGEVGTVTAHCYPDHEWTLHRGTKATCVAMMEDLSSKRRRFREALAGGASAVARGTARAATPLTAVALAGFVVLTWADAVPNGLPMVASSDRSSVTNAVASAIPSSAGTDVDDGKTENVAAAGDDALSPTVDLLVGPDGPTPDVALPSNGASPINEETPPPARTPPREVTVVTVPGDAGVGATTLPTDTGPTRSDPSEPPLAEPDVVPSPEGASSDDAEGSTGTSSVEREAMDELAAMRSAVERIRRGEVVPPEVVAALPHEIAASLREMDALPTAEETATAAGRRLVTLPEDVRRRWRDEAGLPTVPPADTWTSLGGGLRIPLPAGGDISTVEDLEAFGLEP